MESQPLKALLSPSKIKCLFKKIIHLFTCAYIVWVISPPAPFSYPLPPKCLLFKGEFRCLAGLHEMQCPTTGATLGSPGVWLPNSKAVGLG
jgi:hypothetical protein